MSSTNIEKEIVQMVFDAKQFRKGIRESIEELADLKKSFNFNNAQKNLAELEKSSKVDFSFMADGISSINTKMIAMGVIAAQVITSIANSIMDVGKNIAGTLFITPAKQGLEEYETQLNAIQTILANTKKHGTELDDVTAALEELNTYADLTIYNFTEMVRNIGTFTTAGVDLDTSVAAIKGIANAAALSGANATQAATAMYQLSQAVSSGVVRLQDWMSVEKAGLGGEIFKESLMETARMHGVSVDAMIEKHGAFRNSLSENWLSSEILLETLAKFTGDLSEAQLLSLGYSEEQIEGILELGQMANDAATKVKTFTALKDTMAEALGSGWAKSWEIILGDFEEAKELWGAVAGFFGDIIDDSSKARNNMLEGWKLFGGRTIMIEGFFNLFEAGKNILSTIGDALKDIFGGVDSVDLLRMTIAFRDFSERLKMASNRLNRFRNFMRGLFAIFDIGLMIIKAIVKPIAEFVKTLLPATGEVLDLASGIGMAIFYFREFAIETDLFDNIVAGVIRTVGDFIKQVRALVDSFFELEVVADVVRWLKDLERGDFVKVWKVILGIITAVLAPFYLLGMAAKNLYLEIMKLEAVQKFIEQLRAIEWTDIKEAFAGIAEGVGDLVDEVKDSELVGKFIELFQTFDGRRISQFFADAKENFSYLGGIIGSVRDKLFGLGVSTEGVTSGIGDIATTIGDALKTVLDYLIDNAGKVDYAQLFDIINKGLLGGLLLSIRSVFKKGFLGNLLGEDLEEGIGDVIGEMEGVLTSFQTKIKAEALRNIAIALAILAGSIFLMTLIDSNKLTMATTAMVVMLTALFGATGAMRLIRAKDAMKAAAVIVGLSIALAIASIALKNVSGLDPEELEAGLLAMGVGLTGLVVSMKALSSGGGGGAGLIKTIGILIGLSLALLVLSVAIRTFGTMDPEVLTQGLMGVAASLALLVTSMTIMSKLGDKDMLSAAAAIIVMSAALIVLGFAVSTFGEMDVDTLTQGLQSVGIVLAGFAVFSVLVRPKGMIQAALGITIMSGALLLMAKVVKNFAGISWEELLRGLAGMAGVLLLMVVAANAMSGALVGAIATLIMSVAILALAGALKILSTLTWEELLIGLAAIAGVFILLGLAGYILTPVIPTLLLLGVAMLLIGAGAALFGLGMLLAATGLVAIAGSAVGIAAAIGIVGEAVIEILPKLAEGLVKAIASFLATLAEKLPEIIESMRTIFLAMIGAVAGLIPEMVIVILDLITAILEAIAERLPDIIQAGFDILLGFIEGIEDNIADVVEAGLGVLEEFMVGIEKGIPDLVDQAFSTLLTFLEAIDDAIEEYMPQIVTAGLAIGEGIVDGLVDAIDGGLQLVKDAVIRIAKAALDALGLGFLWGSPSKKTYEIGEGFVEGFILAVLDGIRQTRKAMAEFAEAAQDGIKPLIDAIASDIEKRVDFSPVITPVLDLDHIDAGIMALNKSFDNSRVLAELSYSGQLTSEKDSTTGPNGSDGGTTFIQNNYSPKALDRETIYRQTRTQVARLSKKVFE